MTFCHTLFAQWCKILFAAVGQPTKPSLHPLTDVQRLISCDSYPDVQDLLCFGLVQAQHNISEIRFDFSAKKTCGWVEAKNSNSWFRHQTLVRQQKRLVPVAFKQDRNKSGLLGEGCERDPSLTPDHQISSDSMESTLHCVICSAHLILTCEALRNWYIKPFLRLDGMWRAVKKHHSDKMGIRTGWMYSEAIVLQFGN